MKTCIKCETTKSYEEFYAAKTTKDKRQSVCKVCDRLRRKKHYEDKPHLARANWLKLKYNITTEDYKQLFDKQGCKCAICGTKENYRIVKGERQYTYMVVDHCHTTGLVRGLLCYTCNVGIGMLRDNPDYLKSAIEYLDR